MTDKICPFCKVVCEPIGLIDNCWPRNRRCPNCKRVFDGDTGDLIIDKEV